MELEGSLLHSQVLATWSYPEPDQSSPCSLHPTFWSKSKSRVNFTLEEVTKAQWGEDVYLYSILVTTVRITRFRWAGHIVRMQDNLPCKKITLDKPEGRRRVGRPNLRWMDEVMWDAERLGVRNWKSKAKDRDGWRRLLESAKTLHGL